MADKKRLSAVVMGATGDIGSAIVTKLVAYGYFVIATGRDIKKGKKLIEAHGPTNVAFRPVDLRHAQEVQSLFLDKIFDKYPLHVTVACAGILKMQKTDKISLKDWQETIDVNLTGVFSTLQSSMKKMMKRKTGNLIAIGSRWGESGAKHAAAYAASKSALRAFIKSMQYELKDTGIRPMLISPGSVAGAMAATVDRKSSNKYIAPKDVADLIAYVVSTPDNVIFDEIKIKAYQYDLND